MPLLAPLCNHPFLVILDTCSPQFNFYRPQTKLHCRSPGPHPGGKLRGLAWGGLQAHTQGGSWGVWPGGGLQAHTQGGSWGVWPGGVSRPTPRGGSWGVWPGGVSRPIPKGVSRHTPTGGYPSMHWGRHPPPADGYCCGRYASYWNAFLFWFFFSIF